MAMNIRILATGAAVLSAMLFSSGCEKLRARDNLNRGVNAFKNAKYADAVTAFQQAVDYDPEFHTARLYLATAYRSQYIPGAESEENKQLAKRAMEEFQKVYAADPKSKLAIQSIASLHYDEAQGLTALDDKFRKLDEAGEWHKKLIALDEKAKESYYTLGVIGWAKTYPVQKKARVEMKMKDEEPGPLKDKKVLAELQAKNGPIVDEGIAAMRKAIEVDPEYDDAMAYLNLLLRVKADIAKDGAESKALLGEAEDWVAKALKVKKIKAERQPAQTGIIQEGADEKK
jgi:tetratricopeptide (TPR) repeat protein